MKIFREKKAIVFLLPLLLVEVRAFGTHQGKCVPSITSSLCRATSSTRRLRASSVEDAFHFASVENAVVPASIENTGVVFPNHPSKRKEDGTTTSSVLYGGTGLFGLSMGLRMACTLPALSRQWFCSIPLMILASYAIAKSTLQFAIKGDGMDIPDEMYVRNFGGHIFSATASPILSSLILPLLNRAAQKWTFLISMLFFNVGSISEIWAHFKDSWVFKSGCDALQGNENAIFYIGLTGAFSFFAATFSPSLLTLFLASVPPAVLVYRAITSPWTESKGLAIPANAISTVAACAVFIRQFRSVWPLLFYFQSVNIVRNSSRIIATEKQNLHLLPSVYGWFSYVFPFALSLHPATRAANLWTVLGWSTLTIVGTDLLERKIIEHSQW